MTARRVGPVIAVVLGLALWELFARAGGVDALLVATPLDVVRAIGDDVSGFAGHTWITAQEALLGLALAAAIGVATGVTLHLSRLLRDATLPLLIGSQSIPLVVIAPLLVIAFGYGITPKILIVALVCFFPIAIGTFDGLRSADPELLKMLRSLGAGRLRQMRLVELPAALPRILSGVKVSATWAFIGAVFGEYAGSTEGLGYVIARGTPTFQTARVYAAVLILAAASLALYALTTQLERRLTPWHRHAGGH
ncbi:MAG TPA: ABC transporter permease [Solirubrobacterales bacterium]|jgi:ABC-type nitrate/sulfonate/bicarbonate transport system permease component|nr:ABC transporter permease [Solirubrobacterales bacterium]